MSAGYGTGVYGGGPYGRADTSAEVAVTVTVPVSRATVPAPSPTVDTTTAHPATITVPVSQAVAMTPRPTVGTSITTTVSVPVSTASGSAPPPTIETTAVEEPPGDAEPGYGSGPYGAGTYGHTDSDSGSDASITIPVARLAPLRMGAPAPGVAAQSDSLPPGQGPDGGGPPGHLRRWAQALWDAAERLFRVTAPAPAPSSTLTPITTAGFDRTRHDTDSGL